MDIEKITISRHDTLYQAWPDVALLPDDKLVCVFSQCTHHGDRTFTRLVTVESTDRGATWSEPQALIEGVPGAFWNCARISLLGDGRLCIAADHIVGNERNDDEKLTNHLWFSSDAGKTWDGPHGTPVRGIVPDKLIELAGGRWLLAAHHPGPPGPTSPEHGCLEQRVWWSDDRGARWHGPSTVASRDGLNLCEASILPLRSGALVAFMRENSGMGWDGFKSISHDGGETWDGPYHTPLPGCHRPVAGYLSSGKIMVTYRFIQGGRGGWGRSTQNFFAALLDEESVLVTERKEQWARIRPIDFDRSPVADLGYSGWVQFADGEIYIVNYIVDDWPRGQIRGYRLREDAFGFTA